MKKKKTFRKNPPNSDSVCRKNSHKSTHTHTLAANCGSHLERREAETSAERACEKIAAETDSAHVFPRRARARPSSLLAISIQCQHALSAVSIRAPFPCGRGVIMSRSRASHTDEAARSSRSSRPPPSAPLVHGLVTPPTHAKALFSWCILRCRLFAIFFLFSCLLVEWLLGD